MYGDATSCITDRRSPLKTATDTIYSVTSDSVARYPAAVMTSNYHPVPEVMTGYGAAT